MPGTIEKGKVGEDIACEILLLKGYTIAARNYRKKFGEIDLIAFKKKTILFVEVRLKTSDLFGLAEESVTHLKRAKIARVGECFLSENHFDDFDVRIDIMAIKADRDMKGFFVTWLSGVDL